MMTTDTIGGVWTYSLDLARALGRREVRIVLATMGPPPTDEQVEELRHIRNVKPYISDYKLEWMEDAWDDVDRAGQWLLNIRDEERPDLVHLNGYVHGNLNWNVPCLIAGHSCVMSWWNAVKGQEAPECWNTYRKRVSEGLHACQMVIAPSKAMLNALKNHYGFTCGASVIYNGRNGRLFRPGIKESFVFAAGRAWDEGKNIGALEEIAPDLAWPVYVAGEGENPNTGAIQLKNVRMLGRLGKPEMLEWYSRASVYALPARYEPFGYSALEAGLAGCALVLGDIPSLREVWGDAAVFVDPNDCKALQFAVNGLIEDEDLRVETAARSFARASGYSLKRMSEKYLSVISKLLPARESLLLQVLAGEVGR